MKKRRYDSATHGRPDIGDAITSNLATVMTKIRRCHVNPAGNAFYRYGKKTVKAWQFQGDGDQ